MMKLLASTAVLALFSMLFGPTSVAQERSHPRLITLYSSLTDYFNPSSEWPLYDPNQFGQSVAIRDGIALVGMPRVNEAQGRVAIFRRTNAGWERTGALVANDAMPELRFGQALAVRDNTIIVGATGAAYVFKLVSGEWRQTAKLAIPSADLGINFPASLAYQDGLLVAGAPSSDASTSSTYLFELSSAGTLVRRTRLLSPAGPNQTFSDSFGSSVGMTSTKIVIGAPGDGEDRRGAAYVYTKTGSGWQLQQKLVASDARAYAEFGRSVAINNGIIAIGAPYDDELGEVSFEANGAVYLFAFGPGSVTQREKILPPIGQPYDDGSPYEESMQFGFVVAMSQNRLVAGANERSYGDFNPRGAVFTYSLNGSSARLTGSAEGFISATSIALSNSSLLVGIPLAYENLGWEIFGRAMIFDIGSVQCSGRPLDGYSLGFYSGADGWTPVSGNWSIMDETYVNSTSGASIVSIADQPITSCYVLNGRLFLNWTGGVANSGGYIYDYQDPSNFREVTLARSASDRQLITLSEVRNGARRVVNSAESGVWQPGQWVYLGLDRNLNRTSISVDGTLRMEVIQTPVSAPIQIGVLSRWNLVRFADMAVTVWE